MNAFAIFLLYLRSQSTILKKGKTRVFKIQPNKPEFKNIDPHGTPYTEPNRQGPATLKLTSLYSRKMQNFLKHTYHWMVPYFMIIINDKKIKQNFN